MQSGKMAAAGMALVEWAKQKGTWNALDEVEELAFPDDFQDAFKKDPKALSNSLFRDLPKPRFHETISANQHSIKKQGIPHFQQSWCTDPKK